MAAALPSVRGCPCTNPDEEQFPALVFYGGLPVLKTLHCVKHILNEEECRSVGKAGVYWYDELAVVIVVKGAVQETLGVLEENKRDLWLDRADKTIKMLSELYQEKLVTEDEVKRMKGEGGDLSARVVIVQCTKPPKVVARTVNLLDKYRHIEEARWLRVLNELFTRHLLTAEECSQVARERWKWKDHLYPVLSTKPAEVVQEACQVLEKHGCRVEEKLKMLSELYREKLVTEDEVKRMKGEGWSVTYGVVLVQRTKPAEVVAKTAIVLDKYGHNEAARWLRGEASMTRRWVAGKHLGLSGDSGYIGSSIASTDSGRGSSIASTDSGRSSSIAATSTHSSSHLVEHYQKMSMHSLAGGPCQSHTKLSSEEVEEESKHQESKVSSGPAGEGSDPPREPDSAAVKDAEAALVDLCWIPFGIQSQSVGPEGGKLSLDPSAGAMGGEEGGTIFLEVPPGAVSPAESVEVRSALIPDGPFTLPEGYQLGSMVVYLCYDGRRLTKPCTLSLPHWYGGEDQVRDGLSFAMARHTLKEGESVYHFELLEGGRFAEQRQCGVLEISGHCTFFAAVFKVEPPSLYYASLWTHQVDGAVIADNAMESKVVITYADRVWIEILEEYWKEWKINEAIDGGFVKFGFCDKEVQGMLSSQFGEGWKASLKADRVCSKDIDYPCRGKRDEENLEWEVCKHIYPPPFSFVVRYNSLPDCSKVASMEELIVEGTSRGSLRFPFTVYQVKTPHSPSSPSASSSSSMGGCPTLLSPMDTGDEGSETPSSAHPPNGTCQTAPTSKKAQATSTDSPQSDDAILSEKVYDHPRHLMLFRRHISRRAAGNGRAVLEGVGLDVPTIAACFTAHPLNEEGAVQEGLTKWCGGKGVQPPTWGVLIEAIEYANIAQQDIDSLKRALN